MDVDFEVGQFKVGEEVAILSLSPNQKHIFPLPLRLAMSDKLILMELFAMVQAF